MKYKNVAILITCHNRIKKTLECLNSIYNQTKKENYNFFIFLVDDGSTDGTSDHVKSKFPNIILIKGTGNLYWGGGMYLAWEEAIRYKKKFDYFLWLNNDVILYPNAFSILIKSQNKNDDIIVGSFCDPVDFSRTYGACISEKKYFRPLRFKVVKPNGSPQEVDSINGNGVLIPFEAFKKIGKFDKKFVHLGGDIDYSLRAKKKKIRVLLTPSHIGTCEGSESYAEPKSFKDIFEIKSLTPKIWFRFCFKHGGFFWFVHFLYRYIKIILKLLLNK